MIAEQQEKIPGYYTQNEYDTARNNSIKFEKLYKATQEKLEQALFIKAEQAMSEENTKQDGKIELKVGSWRKARELGMNLLAIKIGTEDVRVSVEWRNGELLAIRPEN